MREIKFRAWDGHQMRTDFDLSAEDGCPMLTQYCIHGAPGDIAPQFKLMQYTGLKDKNGTEIYESDVLKIWEYGYNDGGMGDKQVLAMVDWDDKKAAFTNCIDNRNGVEVIGNIYEHSHLLETKE